MGTTYALTGNPNSGKTTIFNELTGSAQYVGNWSGVTVEKKEGNIRNTGVHIVDLPGIYSMSSSSIDEIIAMNYIVQDKPDGILNVVSASNLERNLYLTLQILEMNVPVVIILNMMDEVKRRNMDVDIKKLGDILGTKIISTGSNDRSELKKIKHIVDEDNKSIFERFSYFSKDIIEAVDDISKAVSKSDLESGIDAKWLALKILEKDQEVLSALKDIDEGLLKKGEELKEELEAKYNEDIKHLLAKQRYAFLSLTAKKVIKDTEGNLEKETLTEKLDKYLTHRILSIPIFLGIMWLIYYITITGLGDMTIGFMEWLIGDFITGAAESGLAWIGASEMVESLVVDGIIGGVGAVLVFVPQIMILFFFISILEDSGYMARIAFMMDRVFKKFGLSGKSIIPMLVGSGCSVPGIMATRTLENERDRKLTIILTPFISCGAKMPVYLLFASAFFASSAHWVVFSLYVLGIGIAMASGMLLSKLRYKGEESGFLLELPPYRIPALKSVAIHMWDKGKDFLIRAGTVIFAASVILWFAQSFDFSFSHVADPSQSILAIFGKAIAPVFIPLGFGDWITSVAFITGFAAKEIVISTLSVLHGVGEGALVTSLRGLYTPLSAYSFMVFILLASPCFAAISVMKKELNSWKETGFAVLYQTGTAYLMAMAVYQIGSLFF
ncbi:ferrous iron transport protein B [Alkalibacter saccharofermentans]|uniref:Ferrous iron transport protein B n=1 Tax=Alkalibacter saccharofermentans DSM 14828 TaxID=1120975 RepID=A0A1M4U9I9_9FIRM|nr:ferrous iron transport protein B [Alkalibacter saccharofermentans]SHE53230.1 ferrous iron transport protein B [Alkalibacter saccharofermentans DSM 14828]